MLLLWLLRLLLMWGLVVRRSGLLVLLLVEEVLLLLLLLVSMSRMHVRSSRVHVLLWRWRCVGVCTGKVMMRMHLLVVWMSVVLVLHGVRRMLSGRHLLCLLLLLVVHTVRIVGCRLGSRVRRRTGACYWGSRDHGRRGL